METYAPINDLSYIVESDGDSWFAHYNNFTNIMESEDYAFGDTPQEALSNFMTKLETTNKDKKNPYIFNDIYPGKDISDYTAEEAYELGVNARLKA